MNDAPAPEDFRFATTIDLGDDAVGFHVHNLQMTEFLFRARNSFLTEVAGVDWARLMASGRNLVIRQLTLEFLGEVREPQILMAGIRAASRRRRSLTLDEAVWVAGSGQVVCRGRSIHIPVQIDPPGAIEVPADLLARLEEHEGREVPLTV